MIRATAARLVLLTAVAALVGVARLEAIDGPGRLLTEGDRVAGSAHLSERPVPGPFGPSAEIAIVDGPARGSRLLARFARDARLPRDAEPGAVLRLSGKFRRAERGEGDFDFSAHLRRRGIAGELTVERVDVTGGRRGGVAGAIDRVRRRAERALMADLPSTSAALGRGMVLGDDEGVPTSVGEDFRDSGLAHTLAASGQNVMLLIALAVPLLAGAGMSHAARIPPLLALVALYVPLAGAGPSIQRAGIMAAAGLLAVLLARPASRWYALALATCGTLALNPRAIGEPGWQLSFAAVAGILTIAPPIRAALGAVPRAVAEGIAVTVAATMATAPLIAHHFETVSLASLPANVAAIPLVAPIMWLGMLRGLVGQVLPAGGMPGSLAGAVNRLLGIALAPLLSAFERLAALFADMPGSRLPLSLGHPAAVAVAYAVLAGALLVARRIASRLDTRASTAVAYVRRLPRRRLAALAFALAAVVTLAVARGLSPSGPPATLTVSFLDVGQGDATLIQHPDGSAILFDGGPPEGGVARMLRRAGVGRLSAVVMTHASRDHHGGLAEVVERFPIEVLVDGGDGTRDRDFTTVVASASARGARTLTASAPLTFDAGSLHVEVLAPRPRPPGPPPEDPNARAVVAVVSCDGFDLLLSGDAESESLLPLGLPDVDAIKIAHHGSADPGLAEVLARSRPELAAIPVGVNGYGHPAPSTLAALRRAEVPTWRTDRNGTVRLSVEDGRLIVDAERGEPVEPGP